MHLPQCINIFCGAARAAKPYAVRAICLIIGLSACKAQAGEIVGYYEARWAGLPAAHIRLAMRETDHRYQFRIGIESRGLPGWFTHFRSLVVADGQEADGAPPTPQNYDAYYDLRRRTDRRISLRFRAVHDGFLAERGEDDNSLKPPLPEEYRQDVLDPLTAILEVRRRLAQHAAPGPANSFKIPIFDGARRFNIVNTVEEPVPSDGLVHVHLTLEPIAGFKGESSEDGDPDSAPRPADAAFLPNQDLLPESFTVSIAHLPFVVRLQHLCASFDPCGPADE